MSSEQRQPNQYGSDPNDIRVAGSDRVYSRRKLLVVLLVPLMMALLQISSINTALPAMRESLNATDGQIQWVLSGYALALGISLVPAGRLGDIFGRSGAFVIGLALFTVSSLLIGISWNTPMLNALRLFQGLGAGIFSPQTTGLIQQYFVGQARARAFSLFGLVISMSVAAGPLISGLLIGWLGGDIGWRASFLLNVPLGIIGIILAFWWLPFGKERRTIGPDAEKVQAEFERLERAAGRAPGKPQKGRVDLDPVGMVLLVIAVLGVMLPFMSQGNSLIWWVLPIAAMLLIGWVHWERWYKRRGNFPMVDLGLFEFDTFSYATAIATIQFFGTPSVFVVLAMFLQQGLGESALTAGILTLPNAIMSGYGAIWGGKRAVNHGRAVILLAMGIMLVSLGAAIAIVFGVENGMSFWWLTLPITVFGFGQGAMGSSSQTQSMLDVPAAHGGAAGGVSQTAQRIATAIGIAMITAVFFGSLHMGGNPNWYRAIAVAFALVCGILFLGTALAAYYWLKGRRRQAKPE